VRFPADAGGICHDGVLFCEETTTIAVAFLTAGPLGPPVPGSLMQRVILAVRRALGDVLPQL
jgi:DMSO/TMAO reductase YedYZ heme-binding membrane subunit